MFELYSRSIRRGGKAGDYFPMWWAVENERGGGRRGKRGKGGRGIILRKLPTGNKMKRNFSALCT